MVFHQKKKKEVERVSVFFTRLTPFCKGREREREREAIEVVFSSWTYRNIDLFEHVDAFSRIDQRNILGSRDNDNARKWDLL